MIRIKSFFLTLICVWFLCAANKVHAAADNVVGMVLDVHGNAQLVDKGATVELQLLAYVKPGMQLRLPAGSRVSLSIYATRALYQITGPTLVEIGKDGLATLQGKVPTAKPMAEKLVTAAQAADAMPGAYRLRPPPPKVVLLTPENRIVLSHTHPDFCWSAAEPARYDISLTDESDHVLAGAQISATCWQPPADVTLEYGKAYRWEVSYLSAKTGQVYRAEAEFSILDATDAQRYAALKPARTAPIEEWIMYASVLQNRQLREEAHTAWQFIAAQRPDLLKVQELAK